MFIFFQTYQQDQLKFHCPATCLDAGRPAQRVARHWLVHLEHLPRMVAAYPLSSKLLKAWTMAKLDLKNSYIYSVYSVYSIWKPLRLVWVSLVAKAPSLPKLGPGEPSALHCAGSSLRLHRPSPAMWLHPPASGPGDVPCHWMYGNQTPDCETTNNIK
jgi:hypothetical protein